MIADDVVVIFEVIEVFLIGAFAMAELEAIADPRIARPVESGRLREDCGSVEHAR